jgi:hypothetical protein
MVMSSATGMPGEWSFWTWLLLAVLVGGMPVGYLVLLRHFSQRDGGETPLSAAQRGSFFGGLGLATVALYLPMDVLGMEHVFTHLVGCPLRGRLSAG